MFIIFLKESQSECPAREISYVSKLSSQPFFYTPFYDGRGLDINNNAILTHLAPDRLSLPALLPYRATPDRPVATG